MKFWRQPVLLASIAGIVALFILLVERPARLARARASGPPLVLPGFAPGSVTGLEVRWATNTILVRRTNDLWQVAAPDWRAAQPQLVDGLLRRVATLRGRSVLSTTELHNRPNAAADFGLNPPAATLTFLNQYARTEIRLGTHQINGSRVFYQVTGVAGIFAAEAELLDTLPIQPQGWRDTTLVTVDPLDPREFDRVRVNGAGGGFTLVRSGTNREWELTEPRPARADAQRVAFLLEQLKLAQVLRFIAPTAAPPAEVSGLHPPRLVLSLAQGSNEVYRLAFGAELSQSGAVLAQREGERDLLAVPLDALELLRISYKQLLDRRVLRFSPGAVQEVLFEGPDDFRVVQNTSQWSIEPSGVGADRQLVARLLDQLSNLDILDIAKEVVTPLDLPTYGLAPPARRITLRSTPGNTNSVVAVLETGALSNNLVFTRVPGEEPVYALNPAQVDELPTEDWQLRDRTLWRFNPAAVSALRVRENELEWSVRHLGTNEWATPPSWRNDLNPFALEEAVYQFSQARALRWVAEGEARAAAFGMPAGARLQVEFRPEPGGPPVPPLRVTFGKTTLAGNRYASMTTSDGMQLIFEFPGILFDNLWKEIGLAGTARSSTP